tara:strand:+ start:26359 stop:27273 length:915 start_codon:yes stop_codon:yes gene_type:complete
MKFVLISIFSIISTFVYCQDSYNSKTDSSYLTIDTNITFKHFEDLQVFQYFYSDSLNGKITYSEKIDSFGNVIARFHKDYKTDLGNGKEDMLTINEYDEHNQLKSTTIYFETFRKGEVDKTFYHYNDSLLVLAETYELKKRLKPDIHKGIASHHGCIVLPEDYEEHPTWALRKAEIFKYDSLGRKTGSYCPVFFYSHNRWEYQYDDQGKLIVSKSFDQSKLLYTSKYRYTKNKIIEDLDWVDWSDRKYIETYDQKNNLINKSTIILDSKWVDRYYYNQNNQLLRFEAYDKDDKLQLTHIYLYKK